MDTKVNTPIAENAAPAASDPSPATDAPPAPPGDTGKPKDPVKTITKSVLITLAVMFIYHVASDRVTPYTSQSNIEVLLVQIAPQVTGQVIEVATHDNERVKKGQLLYRIDPEPFEIALRVAEANLAVVQQNLSVSGSPGAIGAVRAHQAAHRTRGEQGARRHHLRPDQGKGAVGNGFHQGPLRDRARHCGCRESRGGSGKRQAETRSCGRRQSSSCSRRARRSPRRNSISPTRP